MIRSLFAAAFCGVACLMRIASAQDSDEHSPVLKRIDMEMLFNELENRGVRLGLIKIPSDPNKAMTLAKKAKQIETIPEADRTHREKMLLRELQQHLIPDSGVVGYDDDTLSITLPADLPQPVAVHRTLQKVVALDPRYELIWLGDFPVICPRHDALRDVRVDLTLDNVPAFQAVGALSQELARHDVNFGEAFEGPGNPEDVYGKNNITLHFEHVPLIEALTQFANALGPGYNWEIIGIAGYGRNCGIGHVNNSSL